ncbi:MAG: branched-chain amino acid ABC transporter permease [Clostridia bacterium]|nr:branched-chain amino acid ABC transporter permease [Clostridia bacterium]
MANIKWKRYINYMVITAVALLCAILSLTGVLELGTQLMLEKIAIAIVLAVSLSMVVGFLGELSLGHAGFMCIGAYIGGKFASMMDVEGSNHLVLIVTMVIGGLVAAVCGFIIGLPALRLKGDYLAIVTLAFGEIVRSIFLNSSESSFGATLGLKTPRYDEKFLFIYGFGVVLIALAVIQNIIRSKHGRAITAIRDNEIAAKATGINVTKYKLIVFVVSAFFAGVAGVLFSHANFNVRSQIFDYNYSIEILVMVVLGGMGNINGAIISATLITFLNEQLGTILTGELALLKDLLYALILILLVIYNNAPALKNFRSKYNLRNLWKKIFKPSTDPARHRDDEAAWDRVPTKISMDEILSTDLKPGNDYRPDKPTGGDQ